MAQYINKDAVVAEIEKLIKKNELYLDENTSDAVRFQKTSAYSVLCDLRHFLDTLEVKEVDLEKELNYDNYMTFFKEHPDYSNGDWGFDECWVFAEYFFELGLKAQKGG